MKPGKDLGSPWRIGCAGFSMRLSEYFDRFNVVEVQESFYDPPTERTLAKWRRTAPEGFAFTMRAWQLITHPASYSGYQRIRRPWDQEARHRFGLFQPTEQTKWAWGIVRRSAKILDAKAIVFHTPSSFTPTRENKENFARFFGSVERGPYHLAWEPGGMWEDEEIEALCREFGLIGAIDPLISEPWPGEIFYFRINEKTRSRGAHGEDDFFQIQGRAVAGEERVGEGFLIWNTRDAAQDAHRFRKWCANT
jgi:uncharacterized protein YecE (DUF72 family)